MLLTSDDEDKFHQKPRGCHSWYTVVVSRKFAAVIFSFSNHLALAFNYLFIADINSRKAMKIIVTNTSGLNRAGNCH
jgi:hypothetical protein